MTSYTNTHSRQTIGIIQIWCLLNKYINKAAAAAKYYIIYKYTQPSNDQNNSDLMFIK